MDVDSALHAAYQEFETQHSHSRAAIERAAQALPGGNTRSSLFSKPFPVTLERGSGCHVRDVDGHDYVDALGEFTASITGHSHPVVMEAIKDALAKGINLGGQVSQEATLSQAIQKRFPSMELMRFCNSGTEATLFNLLTACAHTGRSKVVVFMGAYHGGAFNFPFGKVHPNNAPFDYLMAQYNDAEGAERLLRDYGNQVACVLVEGMIGSGGCIPASEHFLRTLRLHTEQVGALMILDEVMTSRLSPGGLQQHFGITPDLTSLGKYIGGGMTFGAFGGRASIMGAYDPRKPNALQHGGTFNNNVLSMSAGAAVMTKVCTPEAINALNAHGEALRVRLNRLSHQYSAMLQWTGMGSMMMPHFVADPINSPGDAASGNARLKELLYLHLLKHGVWTTSRCMFSLSIVMGDKECGVIAAGVESFLATYQELLVVREP